MPSSADLAVVVPCYNEEANITQLISEWDTEFSQLGITADWLLINDGSTDGTQQLLEQLACVRPNLRFFSRANTGHGRSCRFGYQTATDAGYPWILQVDSDGQCDPVYFQNFWRNRLDADCVFGVRQSRDDGWMRVWISWICRIVASILAGTDLLDANVPYRLIRGPILKAALERIPEDVDLQNVALTFQMKRITGLRWRHEPIHFRARREGVNSIHLFRIIRMGFGLIRDLNWLRRE
jgi:glycosyltransferase involved in cell wall biosynthesis